MVRIRGSIGQWPVDLTLELDDSDWAQLGAHLGGGLKASTPATPAAPEAPRSPATQDDRLWQDAQQRLQHAGALNGPDLLAQLEALTGSAAAGKRLLVRLRHSTNVKVESGADAPLYRWVGDCP
ncbi:hypothetical protein ASF84_26090 [Pseudomonas sp. Leaf127]|uniref:hypothetical protein n=1 Tax=Pseudomonas sp. Leaf127 TaxID=1736267 RepID=UPI000702F1A3|nr:hypothetical protein [Pseudomonas sp. Leaf127]KQQ64413.1 hypothetical protein ASF84_26090 [Pseudomonas sp. Leaf127]